jgi:3-oxoadipate CoA-transferase beta subunit
MMEHQTKSGERKIVDRCTYPLTGVGCVSRIYTDLAVIDISEDGLIVRDLAPGLTLDELQIITGVPMRAA